MRITLLNKEKRRALNKVLKPKKDFKSMWTEAYRDMYATIRE